MRKIPWELLLVFVLLVAAAVAVQQAAPEEEPSLPALDSESVAPEGGRALYLWLQSLGYKVERVEYGSFPLDESTSVMFVLAPTVRPTDRALLALERWVGKGGTLIIAGDAPKAPQSLPLEGLTLDANSTPEFLRAFGLGLENIQAKRAEAEPSQPILLHPLVNKARVEAGSYITGPTTLVSYLGEPKRPVAAGLALGDGKVYVLAGTFALSNEGLREADNAALLLNWLPAPADSKAITFDEIHHGRIEQPSFLYRLVHEPWGWVVLYVVGILFLHLLLGGRRFGKAVPKIVDTRRVAAEYVLSLANLLRRGRKSDWVARHYERTLRLELAAVCGLDPALGTAEMAERLGQMDQVASNVTGQDASRLLLELRDGGQRRRVSEGRLVRLAAEADRIIKECGRRRR